LLVTAGVGAGCAMQSLEPGDDPAARSDSLTVSAATVTGGDPAPGEDRSSSTGTRGNPPDETISSDPGKPQPDPWRGRSPSQIDDPVTEVPGDRTAGVGTPTVQ
jgi:hypothetical protein